MRTGGARLQCRQLRIHRFPPADVFQFRLVQLPVRCFAEVLEFFRLQLAHFARLDIEHQWTVPDTTNLLNVVADLLEHLAQLAVAAFDDDDFVPGIVAMANFANLRRRGLHTT